MSALRTSYSRPRLGRRLLWACSLGGVLACSAAAPTPSSEHGARTPADAPLVASQPGAWFDAQGDLTVVGPGRRLRLVLSAPVSACAPAFDGPGSAAEVTERASLPFHVLAEACRSLHPAILLPAESEGASPAELEHNYHDVARCAAMDLAVTEGWVPRLVAEVDPCSGALGLGWRLPTSAELNGLTLDDRKAIAGALYDTEGRSTFASLLIYARAPSGGLVLSTLSPNSAEQAPALDEDKRQRPLFGAALRCVREDGHPPSLTPVLPPMPHAAACLREQRSAQGLVAPEPKPGTVPELQKLKAWVELVDSKPALLNNEVHQHELAQLLGAPALDQLAREAREERALTERYAELADSLDDPAAAPGELERRRAEFDGLRKRLSGQIVSSVEAAGAARTQLAAVLEHLQRMLERHQSAARGKRTRGHVDYTAALARVRELAGGKASSP